MTERVRFYFDPACPWACQSSRWARRLAQLGVISLDWGLCSLALANTEGADGRHARSQRALRTDEGFAELKRERWGRPSF